MSHEDQVDAVRERAHGLWGDEFSLTRCEYNDGTTVVRAHHVAGTTGDGRTLFEELLWHSERAPEGVAYKRRTVSLEDRPRNETRQDELEGGWLDV